MPRRLIPIALTTQRLSGAALAVGPDFSKCAEADRAYPCLAQAWAGRGADLRVQAPGQA
jgi:hypothetical protein